MCFGPSIPFRDTTSLQENRLFTKWKVPLNYQEFVSSNVASFVASPTLTTFQKLADPFVRESFEKLLGKLHGHAGAYWLVDRQDDVEGLTIAVNVGDRGEEIEGEIFQPLDDGLVSEAFNKNETICPQGMFRPKKQSAEIDRELGQITSHQIAAPLKLFGRKIGAVTVIQSLASGVTHGTQWGFDQPAIDEFNNWVHLSERLLEYNFVRQIG